jgi:hypothetical protein
MAFTSAGLPNNGQTAHYQITYDTSLSAADGVNRAAGLMASCEQDWNLMASWFPGVNFIFSLPITVQITTGSGGASWADPSGFQKLFGFSPTVVINPGSGTSANFVRYLLVSEVTEMFMESQNAGWHEQSSFFSGADEGSMGEGLSRFLGVQFQIANGLGSVPPSGFGVTRLWLNGGRPDFVDNDPDDNKPDPTTGCTTCFLYYLHDQLGKGIQSIVGAGASNLAGVYHNLTGQPNAWNTFISLVNSHYPGAILQSRGGQHFPSIGNGPVLAAQPDYLRVFRLDDGAAGQAGESGGSGHTGKRQSIGCQRSPFGDRACWRNLCDSYLSDGGRRWTICT